MNLLSLLVLISAWARPSEPQRVFRAESTIQAFAVSTDDPLTQEAQDTLTRMEQARSK